MSEDPNEWRTQASRQKAIQHIEEAIRSSGNPTNKTSAEMESHVFQRAKTREEYLGFLSRLILLIKKQKPSDPMNALQNLAGHQPVHVQQQQQQLMFQQQQDQTAMLQNMTNRNQMVQPPSVSQMNMMQMQQQQQRMQQLGQMNMVPVGGMMRQVSPAGVMHARAMSPAMAPQPSPAFPAASPSQMHGLSPAGGGVRPTGPMSAPSPQLNTPAAMSSPSPRTQHEDLQYMEKVKQLSKYIEPIKRMIENTSQQDTAKQSKMRKLLDILENPSRQYALELLVKCEQVLEKLEINQNIDGSHVQPHLQHTTHKEYQVILDTVNMFSKTPYLNHTLGRTVGPMYSALRRCTLRFPSARRARRSCRPGGEKGDGPVSLVLQREVAGLAAGFKVNLDQTYPSDGGRGVCLCVHLDASKLPSVPTLRVIVPASYPHGSPRSLHQATSYSSTPFLAHLLQRLNSRLQKLPDPYSLSQMLHQWEMAVRQAALTGAAQQSVPAGV